MTKDEVLAGLKSWPPTTLGSGCGERILMEPRLLGYSHEGKLVYEDDRVHDLSFCFVSAVWWGFEPSVSLTLEFNRTAQKKRRPYIVANLLGLRVQSGWLF